MKRNNGKKMIYAMAVMAALGISSIAGAEGLVFSENGELHAAPVAAVQQVPAVPAGVVFSENGELHAAPVAAVHQAAAAVPAGAVFSENGELA